MINSRSIQDLLPRVQDKCNAFIRECAEHGIEVIITSTYRDLESQDALYAQGRTKPGKKVTNVAAGKSFHNWRVAFDFVPVVAGKAVWDDDDLWGACGACARAVGLEWGGDWENFVDRPHCQDTGGYTIAQYVSGEAEYMA